MGRECVIQAKDGIFSKRLVGDLNEKKSLGRLRYRWEGNVTVRLKESQNNMV
jgi:hypothetical protein